MVCTLRTLELALITYTFSNNELYNYATSTILYSTATIIYLAKNINSDNSDLSFVSKIFYHHAHEDDLKVHDDNLKVHNDDLKVPIDKIAKIINGRRAGIWILHILIDEVAK
ncbi:17978_t:CDS:2 [Acaulospora morrowiae]|uniref:17978_t:CDS:1 n=1 Tax=Acaulospora morrowiae TaxID=94023 RepID=A0A9N8ZAU3_9GLOM|nr:17978_t:CDS:2 [Acaulospora morrowiae]